MMSQKKINFYLLIGFGFIAFNLWHTSIRSFWNGSIKNSLSIGQSTIQFVSSQDPEIKINNPYDGQFFYVQTFNPFLLEDQSLNYIQPPIYRGKRMFYPLAAHLLSFGKSPLYPYALFFINIFAWIFIGLAAYRIAKDEKLHPVLVTIGVFTITGINFSALRTLAEPLALALVLWGCFAWRRNLTWTSVILFSLAGLTRDDYLLVPAVICLITFVTQKSKRIEIIKLALSAIPFLLWTLYLHSRFPGMDYDYTSRLGLPGVGVVNEMNFFLAEATSRREIMRTISVIVFLFVMALASLRMIFINPSFWGVLTFSQLLFSMSLRGDIWNHYAGSIRIIIPLMAFFIIWVFETHQKKQGSISPPRPLEHL